MDFISGKLNSMPTIINPNRTTKIITSNNSGLVGYWPMSEGSADTAHDFSGNNNHGQLVNSPNWVDGNLGKAIKGNGTTSYVKINHNDIFSFGNGGTDRAFSLSAWIFYLNGEAAIIINKYQNASPFLGEFDLSIQSTGAFGVAAKSCLFCQLLGSGTTNRFQIESTTSIPRDIWSHTVFTYDGSKTLGGMKLYLNGLLMAIETRNQNGYVGISNRGGALGTLAALPLDASNKTFSKSPVSQIRIYNKALSPAEVSNLYQAGL